MNDKRNGHEKIERYRDFFDLQLRFAAAVAEKTSAPISDAVLLTTNFHRRFGLGDAPAGTSGLLWQSNALSQNSLLESEATRPESAPKSHSVTVAAQDKGPLPSETGPLRRKIPLEPRLLQRRRVVSTPKAGPGHVFQLTTAIDRPKKASCPLPRIRVNPPLPVRRSRRLVCSSEPWGRYDAAIIKDGY